MIICCTTNDKYVKFTLGLINSIRKNCTTQYKIICRCVNVCNDNLNLLGNDTNIEIVIDNRPLSTAKNITTPEGTTYTSLLSGNRLAGYLKSEEACYCSNIRFYQTLQALKSGEDVLYMDVDAIVRGDLMDLPNVAPGDDIIIRRNVDEGMYGLQKRMPISEPDNVVYQQGFYFVRSCNLTLRFYEYLADKIQTDMKNWNADQIMFLNATKKFPIKIGQLPTIYRDSYHNPVDGGFKNESIVWCGGWVDKYTNNKYLAEFEKYAPQHNS